MGKKNKSIPNNQRVSGSKKAKEIVDAQEYKKKFPVWRFNKYDKEHQKWCLHNKDFYSELMSKLIAFESMTWHQIEAASGGRSNGTNNHFILVSDLVKEAQKRLEELHLYYDELFSLRLSGKERLFGILEDGVYHILWYDANHEICPSKKK